MSCSSLHFLDRADFDTGALEKWLCRLPASYLCKIDKESYESVWPGEAWSQDFTGIFTDFDQFSSGIGFGFALFRREKSSLLYRQVWSIMELLVSTKPAYQTWPNA